MAAIRSNRRSGAAFASLPREEELGAGTSFNLFGELAIFGSVGFTLESVSKSNSGTLDVSECQFGLGQEEVGLGVFGFLLERLEEIFFGLGCSLIVQGDYSQIVQGALMLRIDAQRRFVKRYGLDSVALGEAKISESQVDFRVVGGVELRALQFLFRAMKVAGIEGLPAGVIGLSGPKRRVVPW